MIGDQLTTLEAAPFTRNSKTTGFMTLTNTEFPQSSKPFLSLALKSIDEIFRRSQPTIGNSRATPLKQFRENMADHMQEHRKQFKSWKEVSHKEAEGHQVLGCQWVFRYKTDKHGNLQKCKARLVVCGNQQRNHDLSTRATTLLRKDMIDFLT